MDQRVKYRPTLIVGVGGTGCEIAERVYRWAKRDGLEGRGRIAVMGFDTDANDIARRGDLDPRNIIRTSSLDTVYQILEKNPQAERSFSLGREALPNRFLNMKLIDGAAQIRMLSHLALYDQMSRRGSDVAATVGNVVAQLARHDGRTEFEGLLNVILCGSLAGATGSGMAVQTALLLRRIALARGVKGVSVRGLFLLPDVFVQAASLGAQQVDNVLANGYAALRELAAVIARAEDVDTARDFQYEFAPGQFLQSSELPFEAVTLIDFENVAGGSLGANLGSYKEMATRTVYLQTFTTLGAETLSRVINDMPAGLDAAARRTTNIFSGIGIAAVKYPAETIRDYLGHRFAQEALAGDWLRLDRVFRDELHRYEELKAAGNQSVRTPDIAVTYLESLDQFARRDRIAFFMEIFERLRPVLVDPETRAERRIPLADQFLDAFLAQVSETFWSSRALQDIRARGVFEPTALRPRDKIPSVVRASENLLDADFAAIESALADQPDRIYNNMITVEDDRAAQELQPYNLQYYLVRGGPHPVQVRAFLYETLREARGRRDALDVDGTRDRILAVGDVFRDDRAPDGPDEERDTGRRGNLAVLDRAGKAARPGFVGRALGTTNKFVEEYSRYYDDTVQGLKAYGQRGLERKALEALIVELEGLVATYEALFAEVGRSLAAVEDKARQLEGRHAATGSFDGNVYVYSDLRAKQDAWAALRARTAAMRQGERVNTGLNAAIYRKHRTDRKARKATPYSALRELFDREVIQDFAMSAVQGDHRAVWDMSVIEAIRREAEVDGTEWTARLQQAIDLVKAQAQPFLRLRDPSDGQAMVFWAMPPSIREDYGDAGDFDRLFTSEQGERPLEAPDFSRTELLCVNSRVNLEPTHLAKLDPGTERRNANEPAAGRYYQAYERRVRKLLDEEMAMRGVGSSARLTSTITPHIHRDWHRSNRLPEIFPEQRRKVRLDVQRATVAAFGLGLLQRETEYGRSVCYFSTIGKPGPQSIREALVESHDLWTIARAFRDRADLIRAALGTWDAEKAVLARDGRFEDNPVVVAVAGADAVARILELAAPREDKEAREADAKALFEGREALLAELAAVLLPHLDAAGRRALVTAFADRAAGAALDAFARLEGIQRPTVEQLRAVYQAGSRDGRGAAAA
jgi:hypothetical protein